MTNTHKLKNPSVSSFSDNRGQVYPSCTLHILYHLFRTNKQKGLLVWISIQRYDNFTTTQNQGTRTLIILFLGLGYRYFTL